MQTPSQYLRRRRPLFAALSAFFLCAAFQYPQITMAANTQTAASIQYSPLVVNASISAIAEPLLHFLIAYTLLMLTISIAGTLFGLMLFERLFPLPASSDEGAK